MGSEVKSGVRMDSRGWLERAPETNVIHLRQLLWGLAIGSIVIGFVLLII